MNQPLAIITDLRTVAVLVAMAVAITALVVAAIANRRANAARDRLQRIDDEDVLTGLPVPAKAREAVLRHLGGPTFAFLVLELDQFANVNKTHGQDVGDRLLASLGSQLRDLCHRDEVLTRWSGPRFAVLGPDLSTREAAEQRARELQSPLDAKVTIGLDALRVSVSVAVVMVDASFTTMGEITTASDLTLDEARRTGRQSCITYRTDLRRPELKEAAHRLQQTLAEQFSIDYQPIVTLPDHGIAGMRAEARWQDLGRGILSGPELNTLLTRADRLTEAGQRALELAVHQAAVWTATYPDLQLVVIVPLPSELLFNPELPSWLRSIVAGAGLDPPSLCIEVTSHDAADLVNAWAAMSDLRQQGIHVALADFGTGWSSLAYLRRSQVDVITLPADLLDDGLENRTEENIVRQLLGMTTALEVSAIVQGVADRQQEDTLITLGCDLAMGPRYGPARSVADMDAILVAGEVAVDGARPSRGGVGTERR